MKYDWQLYHWHFEISGKCTLKCPRCPRNDTAPVPWMNKDISLELFKKILSPELLVNTVRRITFCGDIGDPIYNKEFLEIVRYIKTSNPNIHLYTITNGSHKKESWWREFASLCNERDTINFSIDGFDNESNNKYRVNSNWDSIMRGVEIMCKESKSFVYWAAIVFSFNQDKLDHIKKMATDIGCDGLQLTYSTKFGSKYGDSYGGETDDLEPREEFISKTYRYERHFINLSGREPNNEDYLAENKEKYIQIKKEHDTYITPLCKIGNRALYVSADGVLHPCSWVSFPFVAMATDRKTIKFQDSFHQMYREKLNLNHRTLAEILNDPIWEKLHGTFDNEKKAWVECEQKCHKGFVTEPYAVGWLTN